MEQIKRIIIILLAAMLVTGATFAIAQSSSSAGESAERPAFSETGERPAAPFGEGSEGGQRRGQGGFNMMEIGKSVIIMTIVSALIIIGDLVISRFRPKRTLQLAE